jgi:hypothetical protein
MEEDDLMSVQSDPPDTLYDTSLSEALNIFIIKTNKNSM